MSYTKTKIMRDIKFRAWVPGKEVMQMAGSLAFWLRASAETGINPYQSQPDIIFLQFTGLKDKKGVEIFEGDIVRYPHDCDTFGECKHGKWDLKEVKCDGQCFYTEKVFTQHENYQGVLYVDEAEVIGNIYENPELLK